MPSIDDILAEVDRWFAERIQKGPIAHQVNCYNQAHHARADLKDRLSALVTGKPAAVPKNPAAEPVAAEDREFASTADGAPKAAAESKAQPTA